MENLDGDSAGRGLPELHIRQGIVMTVLVGMVVTAAIIVIEGRDAVLSQIAQLPFGWLALATGLNALAWGLQGLGLAALGSGNVAASTKRMTRAFLGGEFAALVTPFGTGGLVAGVYCVHREGPSTGEATAMITLHSMLTAAYFVLVALIAVVALPVRGMGTEIVVAAFVSALVIGTAVVIWLVGNPIRVAGWLGVRAEAPGMRTILGRDRSQRLSTAVRDEARRFSAAIDDLVRDRPSRLLLSFAAVCLSRVLVAASLIVVLEGFGWAGPVLPFLLLSVGIAALAVVTPIPGGSGVTEIFVVMLLASRTSASLAGAATLVWRGVSFYAELFVGGVVFAHYLATHRRDSARSR